MPNNLKVSYPECYSPVTGKGNLQKILARRSNDMVTNTSCFFLILGGTRDSRPPPILLLVRRRVLNLRQIDTVKPMFAIIEMVKIIIQMRISSEAILWRTDIASRFPCDDMVSPRSIESGITTQKKTWKKHRLNFIYSDKIGSLFDQMFIVQNKAPQLVWLHFRRGQWLHGDIPPLFQQTNQLHHS